jgi:hypothetical protein
VSDYQLLQKGYSMEFDGLKDKMGIQNNAALTLNTLARLTVSAI